MIIYTCVQWRAIGTAGHNALLVFTHNYALFTLWSHFLGCNVHANQLQLVAWALLGNHSNTITIACGCSKSTYIMAVMGTLVYGANTLCV